MTRFLSYDVFFWNKIEDPVGSVLYATGSFGSTLQLEQSFTTANKYLTLPMEMKDSDIKFQGTS